MPMYEFFCNDCNTIYTFFSRKINTESIPPCPKSNIHQLERMVSRFAVTGTSRPEADSGDDSGMPDIDESKMEQALASLASEAEHINEDDPRQAANLMRKLTDMTGLKLGDKMEDALCRMEAGEDPDSIEQEMGNIDESELFSAATQKSAGKKRIPYRDEKLYEM